MTGEIGLCATGAWDPDLWFLRKAGEVDRAKTLCRRCPQLDECLARALAPTYPLPDHHQVVAGLTTKELLKRRGGKRFLLNDDRHPNHRISLTEGRRDKTLSTHNGSSHPGPNATFAGIDFRTKDAVFN